jgi:hypothetical protein
MLYFLDVISFCIEMAEYGLCGRGFSCQLSPDCSDVSLAEDFKRINASFKHGMQKKTGDSDHPEHMIGAACPGFGCELQ